MSEGKTKMANRKIYKIKFLLSNNKTIIHDGKRDKIINEWHELLELPIEKIMRKLKLHKDKMIKLDEIILYDWVGNKMINKIFEENLKETEVLEDN